MNIADFTYLLQNPARIDAEQTQQIGKIVEEFPYFQAARVVHLKGLKAQDSFTYNQHLKKAAAYTTERSILFEFITSESFAQHTIANTITERTLNLHDIEVHAEEVFADTNVRLENTFETKFSEADAILDPDLFQPKSHATENHSEKTPEETLQLGKPLSFEKSEKHSFAEWLQLTKMKPIDRNETTEKVEESNQKEKKSAKKITKVPAKKKKFELIDQFIAKNPKIKPASEAQKNINLAAHGMVDQSALMTETLAKVYLEQKKYKKAIKAYNILILKYPEKSGFFADQIRAIKKLQQNK